MQISTVAYDEDVGTLRIETVDSTEYLITNIGHARLVKQHIGPGGNLDHRQLTWLEKYRVLPTSTDVLGAGGLIRTNVLSLKKRLGLLRSELKPLLWR